QGELQHHRGTATQEAQGMRLIGLLFLPPVVGFLIAITRRRAVIELIHVAGVLGLPLLGLLVAVPVWHARQPMVITAGIAGAELAFRIDALSGLMVSIISGVGAIVGLYSIGYMRAESGVEHDKRGRTFFALFHGFIFTMLVAVTTDNLGVMWVAIEGTTLTAVFLVNLHNTASSLEAAYKYLIISSVSIALAFIGTALTYYAGAASAGEVAVNWSSLQSSAASLDPNVVRLAFVFVLVGYGTKTGLAPMHTWLP